MQFITFTQLRDSKSLKQLEAWLVAGETVELRYRNRLVAHFVPVAPKDDAGEAGPSGRADSG